MPLASEVSRFLALPLAGPDMAVTGVASLGSLKPGALVFAVSFDEGAVTALNALPQVLAIVPGEYAGRLRCSHIVAPRPRLAFAKAASRFFGAAGSSGIARTAVIGKDVRLGRDVSIGEYCVVEDGASIGDGTRLMHHVVVGERCVIGRNCRVKSHTVVGGDGFGFERGEDGTPVHLPHVGRVVIGDHVHLGNFNSIDRATFDATVVEDHVKTDDHVHIGHNAVIGAGTLLTACAEISGSVKVGRNVWIGPNSAVIDKVAIGDRAFVGIGAVVTKDVPADASVAGNPARRLATPRD